MPEKANALIIAVPRKIFILITLLLCLKDRAKYTAPVPSLERT
jgi:hypothetical protein